MFRILLYVVVFIIVQVSDTYYLPIGYIPNLFFAELYFQVNTIQAKSHIKSRIIGVVLISSAAIIGVNNANHHINSSLYLIFLATCIFVVHG